MIQIETVDDGYKLVIGETESEAVPFNEELEVEIDGKTYKVCPPLDDEGEPDDTAEYEVWIKVADDEVEIVELEDDDGDGGEEEAEEVPA